MTDQVQLLQQHNLLQIKPLNTVNECAVSPVNIRAREHMMQTKNGNFILDTMTSSSSQEQPPLAVHHPLHLLDQFLLSLPTPSNNQHVNGDHERNGQILQIADFLYGKSSNTSIRTHKKTSSPMSSQKYSGSILDSALELLDSFEEESLHGPSIPSLEGSEYGHPSGVKYSAPIRMLIAKRSRRMVVVVRGSRGRGSSDYLVTLGSPANSIRSGANSAIVGRWGYHCSCRSFFEKLKFDRFALCKHLLAARLAPFLCIEVEGNESSRSCIYQEEEVEDEEFGNVYSRLSLASWY